MKKKHKEALRQWQAFVDRTVLCGDCGAIVGDAEKHDSFHDDVRKTIGLVAIMATRVVEAAASAREEQ